MMDSTDFTLQSFEDSGRQNGIRYWNAHDFMRKLGYDTWGSFYKVINKAMASCATLNVPIHETFISDNYIDDGKEVAGFKLTRFACFLVTMHADEKKPKVAKAKIVLAAVADALVEQAIQNDAIERIDFRQELSIGDVELCRAASQAGIESGQYGIFKDAGIRGLYNMPLKELIGYKGGEIAKGKTLYDYMGKTELAANIFRVTMTAEKIKNTNTKGLKELSNAAKQVGKEVREVFIRSSGGLPEDLPLEEDGQKVESKIKKVDICDRWLIVERKRSGN